MMTFLTILAVLVIVNIAMVVASLLSVVQKTKAPMQKTTNKTISVIYPLDLLTTDFKKAV